MVMVRTDTGAETISGLLLQGMVMVRTDMGAGTGLLGGRVMVRTDMGAGTMTDTGTETISGLLLGGVVMVRRTDTEAGKISSLLLGVQTRLIMEILEVKVDTKTMIRRRDLGLLVI